MAIGGAFRELGRFLDDCDRSQTEVRNVEIADCPDSTEADSIVADIDLVVGVQSDDIVALDPPRINSDGTLRVTLETTQPLVPDADSDYSVEATKANFEQDSSIVVSLRATFGPSEEQTDATRSESAPTTGRYSVDEAVSGSHDEDESPSQDLPPFKDPDYLEDIFESNDTFAEMAEAIEMDVTAETVRRYMIDFGIHEPNSYQTGHSAATSSTDSVREDTQSPEVESVDDTTEADGEPEMEDQSPEGTKEGGDSADPVVLSDGIGLPEGVTVDTLVETVKRSNTIHEVTRAVAVERDDALDLLERLNLLDLVVGRLATEGKRDISRQEIVDRLRQASAVE